VNYILRSSEQFNMVYLVPDGIFNGGATPVGRNVDEVGEIYVEWDPKCSSKPSTSSLTILTLWKG